MTFEEQYGVTREALLREVRLRQQTREAEKLSLLAGTGGIARPGARGAQPPASSEGGQLSAAQPEQGRPVSVFWPHRPA